MNKMFLQYLELAAYGGVALEKRDYLCPNWNIVMEDMQVLLCPYVILAACLSVGLSYLLPKEKAFFEERGRSSD